MIRFYYSQYQNFGDALNPWLVERLFGVQTRWSPRSRAELCGIGSLLQMFARPRSKLIGYYRRLFVPPLHVWSSGFIDEVPDSFLFQRKMVFHALRGKLSLAKAEKLLGRSLAIPLGDGGLLMAGLLEKRPEKRYRLGIIPHVVDRDNPVFARLVAGVPRAQIIDVRESPQVVLETIASCDCIVSTAMHGLIAADSLGIPNRWIEVSDLVQGNGYKFRDYYSVFDLPCPSPLILRPDTSFTTRDVDDIGQGYAIDPRRVEAIQKDLARVFPFWQGV